MGQISLGSTNIPTMAAHMASYFSVMATLVSRRMTRIIVLH